MLGRADRAGRDRLGRLLGPARRARDHRRVHRLERLARVAVGVHAHRVAEAAAEQAVDRHAVGPADEIPQRGLHAGDRVVDDARRRAGARRAPAQLAPQPVDVARVLADQQRRQVAHDPGQARARCSTPRAPTARPVGVDADEGPVVVALDDGGVDGGDLHAAHRARAHRAGRSRLVEPARLNPPAVAARGLRSTGAAAVARARRASTSSRGRTGASAPGRARAGSRRRRRGRRRPVPGRTA